MLKVKLIVFIVSLLFHATNALQTRQKHVIDLTAGPIWTFSSSNGSITGRSIPPGDIYSDLAANGIINDVLKVDNDVAYRWVAQTDWIYKLDFEANEALRNSDLIRLDFDGIDTVAKVYFNDLHLFHADNQFLEYKVRIDPRQLRQGNNTIKVKFASPVKYAAKKRDAYTTLKGHLVPPDCPLEIQHGECHPNFIRKSQASFSWDWGPSIPTVGLFRPVYIRYAYKALLNAVSPAVLPEGDHFKVAVDVDVDCTPFESFLMTLKTQLFIGDTSIDTMLKEQIFCPANGTFNRTISFPVSRSKISLWYPNGYGNATVYLLSTKLTADNYAISDQRLNYIGFRTIELIQDYVDQAHPSKGRNFYFKINDIPIFLKGSNLIPVSALGKPHFDDAHYLIDAAKLANMNTLRLWGGGLFETDDFYEYADRSGILLWHDLMFACALYPTDHHFLKSVSSEVELQVKRLRHHASILVWAGNNENEVAIQTNWWHVPHYNKTEMIEDYKVLYRDTLAPIVKDLDKSRPFLLSSPSNGIETDAVGGVADVPNSEKYGDIHYYNEFIDLWTESNYEIPRCATEFGVQSLPARSTFLDYINKTEYYYTSEATLHRQHHAGGAATLVSMTLSHFDNPPFSSNSTSSKFIGVFTYLTQLHQAIAIQTQTEHYRRWRGRLHADGRGNTMCALYWQLNDVWAAPTWSSIDVNREWKPLHYYARRFFAPVIVSMYLDTDDELYINVVSDRHDLVIKGIVIIDVYLWEANFTPIATLREDVYLNGSGSVQVFSPDFFTMYTGEDDDAPNKYLHRARLVDANNEKKLLAPVAFQPPRKFFRQHIFGDAKIVKLEKRTNTKYTVTLAATSIVPFVWLDLTDSFKKDYKAGFWFSDNAFMLVDETIEVQLNFYQPPNGVSITDLTVCRLDTCGL
uniref:beta-mannosidase n=1 Tax=Panagrellus redivivus TaxID=6233 RepID=A0A7E4VJH1_PANRE